MEHANGIIQQLRDAQVNLVSAHIMVSNLMSRDNVKYERTTTDILLQHFPQMLLNGISSDSALAVALRQALSQHAAPAPAQANYAAPAKTSNRRSAFDRFIRMVTPRQGATTNVSSSPPANWTATRSDQAARRTDRDAARINQTNAMLDLLALQGTDMAGLQAALSNNVVYGTALPQHLMDALQRAGVDTHDDQSSLIGQQLMHLGSALNQRMRRTGGG